jgi:hypothetical protein
MRAPTTILLALACACALPAPAQERERTEVVEHDAEGRVAVRYTVDEQGRRDGKLERFDAAGRCVVLAHYRRDEPHGSWREWNAAGRLRVDAEYDSGVRHGRWDEYGDDGARTMVARYREGKLHGRVVVLSADRRRERTATYRDGELHGAVEVVIDRKLASKQRWRDGELEVLDGLRPFPVARDALRTQLGAILATPPPPGTEAGDVERWRALRSLQAYRALCSLDWEDMTLRPEWNALCDAAAELCRRNGDLSHQPPRPAGIDDDLYRRAVLGASRSNLATGGMVRSVDFYMDDSDPANIDRIGHRRWCLNPAMRVTGFGESGDYSAMWSMDASGNARKGLTAVLYPPAGYVPVDFFGERHAWSVAPLRGSLPAEKDLRVVVRALDGEYVAAGDPLALDFAKLAGGGFGSGPCLIFRPVGAAVEPGRRYSVEIAAAGEEPVYRYVVEFVPPVRGT